MGNLPASRVTPSPPFYNTGVDYAGPFKIKTHKGRGGKVSKAYLCLFVCFSTKAVHLELATDLSMETFLLAFRRFVFRCGKPAQVYSDNGTNFVGAKPELIELSKFIIDHGSKISKTVANDGTTSKHHLKRVLGTSIVTYEEFCTLLIQVEATLNSRPLSPLSSDPNDLQPLAHFLIGRPLTSLPDPDIPTRSTISSTHMGWSKEYISELQQRTKWRSHHSDLKPGTLVLLKDDKQPPLHWKLCPLPVSVNPQSVNSEQTQQPIAILAPNTSKSPKPPPRAADAHGLGPDPSRPSLAMQSTISVGQYPQSGTRRRTMSPNGCSSSGQIYHPAEYGEFGGQLDANGTVPCKRPLSPNICLNDTVPYALVAGTIGIVREKERRMSNKTTRTTSLKKDGHNTTFL
ncbi:hypothetical protein HUJ05_003284 [Dendroctonus ponderosae]|nr:hypothetical protein HUJ05_003284 [Dendroctonus ponderosae]